MGFCSISDLPSLFFLALSIRKWRMNLSPRPLYPHQNTSFRHVFHKINSKMFGEFTEKTYFCNELFTKTIVSPMKRMLFDTFSKQALQTLHRYRAVMFSPTMP